MQLHRALNQIKTITQHANGQRLANPSCCEFNGHLLNHAAPQNSSLGLVLRAWLPSLHNIPHRGC